MPIDRNDPDLWSKLDTLQGWASVNIDNTGMGWIVAQRLRGHSTDAARWSPDMLEAIAAALTEIDGHVLAVKLTRKPE